MSSPGAIDIVIVNYRCHAETLAALAALGDWRHGLIRIVDNSADAAEAAALRAGIGGRADVALDVAEDNLGFGRGCNRAHAASDAEFLLLLNPDARIAAEGVLAMARCLADEPRWAALSPRIYWDAAQRFLLPPAQPQTPVTLLRTFLGRRRPRLARFVAGLEMRRQRRQLAGSRRFETPCLAGAVMMVRRSMVDRAGGLFDPRYFMFYEDADLSIRLRRAGFGLGILPAVGAVHEYRHKAFKEDLMRASRAIFFERHFPRFFRLTRQLAGLERLAAAPEAILWGTDAVARPGSVAEFSALAGDHGVAALSPSPLLAPALLCANVDSPPMLSEADWARLEPGRYLAELRPRSGSPGRRLLAFER